jgi:VIT1/CCC1 family predicted Fe2+/Mn2+ transporter
MLTIDLAPTLQKLIDARLDNIERAIMMTDTSRAERRQIVSAVEDQIYEMLSRLNHDEPTREDVLGVLAALDPPEAYCNGTYVTRSEPQMASRAATYNSSVSDKATTRVNILSIIGVCFAGAAILFAPVWWELSYFGVIATAAFAVTACVLGIIALTQIAKTQWTQKGIGMAIISIASPMFAGILGFLVFLLLNG